MRLLGVLEVLFGNSLIILLIINPKSLKIFYNNFSSGLVKSDQS